MNILIYVMAMLTALSITTYARLDTFLNSFAIRQEIACYVGQKERMDSNDIEKEKYQKHHGQKQKTGTKQVTDATRKISISVYVNEQLRNQNDAAFKTIDIVLRSLLSQLYQNEPFFKKVQEKRGDAINALLSRITQAAAYSKPVKTMNEFISLDLQDQELQTLFAKILTGASAPPQAKECPLPEEQGYPSLLRFIEISSRKGKGLRPIRIQLAPKEILKAIFADQETVNDILEKRSILRTQAKKIGSPEQQVASQEFQSLFKSKIPGNLDPNMFDFTITRTKID